MVARTGGGKGKKGRGKARAKQRIPVRAAPDGSDLCLQCGLCCDGTLFAGINVAEGERDFVESLGLEVEVDSDKRVRALEPCPAFTDGCCSLYQRGRPETCGSYRCELFNEYVGGSSPLDDVLAVIRLVWALARELEQEMGLPVGSYNRRALHEFLAEHNPAQDPATHGRFLVAFWRLNLLGEKYFGYDSKPAEVEASGAGARVAAKEAEATFDGVAG